MPINAVYELKAKYRDSDNRLCENVFFYRSKQLAADETYNSAYGLAFEFQNDVLTPMLALIPQGYTYYAIDCRNLFDPDDAVQNAVNLPTGLTPGGAELFPSFLTAKVSLAVDKASVNKGRKMLTGMYETWASNGLINGTGMTNLAARAALFLKQLVGGFVSGYVFEPIVVKRVREGTEGAYTYRLPTSLSELIYGLVTSAVVSALQTSQVTRKD